MKAGRRKSGHSPLARAELPVDTAALARFLIGKLLVRELPEGVGQRPHCRDRGLCHRRRRRARLSGHDAAQSFALSRARPRLCLSRLWRLLDAECLERDEGRRRRRPDPGARAGRRRSRSWLTIAESSACAISRAGREGSPRRSGSIVRSMGSIFARKARFGWRATTRTPGEIGKGKSERASGSAFRGRRSGCCGSICGASPFVSGAKSLNVMRLASCRGRRSAELTAAITESCNILQKFRIHAITIAIGRIEAGVGGASRGDGTEVVLQPETSGAGIFLFESVVTH